MRVSELITIDEVRQWEEEDIITVIAGTGTGKSYFIKNILYAFAKEQNKKILFLIHRTDCVNQFQKEIEKDKKTDTIIIKTYQYLEALYKFKKVFDFSEYAYIVCDEFHYFLSDASFNISTDMSLNIILAETDKTKIFMSATGDYMKRYINKIKGIETKDYKLPIEYIFIKKLVYFQKDETLEKFIEEAIEKNHKTIFFIQSAQKAYELYNKYKDHCLFNCSKNNDKYYKYVDIEKINNLLENQTFDELILITTTCMDAGVNIIDTNIKHIIVDVKDLGTIIQCIGRKRIQHKEDRIFLYIKTISNKQLGGMKTQLKRKIEKADFLREHTVKEYIEQYPRQYDYSNIVYDEIVEENNKGTKKVNELMYFKCNLDICDIEFMLIRGNYGYCKYLAFLFGFQDQETGKYNYTTLEENYKEESMEEYLEKLIGKKLFKDEQKELIDKIDVRVNSRQQKSYKKLNEGLKMINCPYIIIPKKSNSVRYWIIEKIEE